MNIDGCGVVDLFCGIGGLTHGFVRQGLKVLAGIDADSTCRYAYETNNSAQFIDRDIRFLTASDIALLFGDTKTKILVGCAPCQPFSQYSTQRAKTNSDWELVHYFKELAVQIKPEIISMENVPRLQHHEVFKGLVSSLQNEGYKVFWKVVYGPGYGLPQERKRLILLASLLDEISIIDQTHLPPDYICVRDVIADMPLLDAGDIDDDDPLHICSKLSDINLERIKSSVPGGTWHDWPKELRTKCHRKDSGKGYVGVYGRMEWDKPSPTITTQFYGYGNGRFGHPSQNRAISLREGALLQTFPKAYKFVRPNHTFCIRDIGRYIGNAVPVLLGEVIAKSIGDHLNNIGGVKNGSK